MIERTVADLRQGKGPARPQLILAWLIAGAVLTLVGFKLDSAGIQSWSGTVTSVDRKPPDGMGFKLESSSQTFYWDASLLNNNADSNGVLLPDVRVGDQVELLTDPAMLGWVDAVQSSRGTWFSYYSESVSPFTPRSWPLHLAAGWVSLTGGLLLLLLGLISLCYWIPRRAQHPVPVPAAPLSVAARAEARVLDSSEAVPGWSDQRQKATGTGALTLLSAAVLEAVVLGAAGPACTAPKEGWEFVVLLLVPLGLLAGGIAALILGGRAARSAPAGETVAGARALGVVCLALALVGGAANLYTLASWAFCF